MERRGRKKRLQDPDGDFWVGCRRVRREIVHLPGRRRHLSGEGRLKVRLKAAPTPRRPDHHATFSLSTHRGRFWDGTQDLETTVEFDPSLLVDGDNSLTIDGLTDTGAPYSLFYVDSFDVSYVSRYRAHGNRVEAPASGNASVLISGFTRSDITVFDITLPARPVIVQAPVSLLGDGTYGVVVASRNPQAVYYALTPDAVRSPSRILPDLPSALRPADNEGEYLVITTQALKATAQLLADHRSDLRSQVVDIEDVYDEFNHGISSPYALKAFLAHARTRWRRPPLYVVLAADGSYDYKDVLGEGDNLIPPMMANTPAGLSLGRVDVERQKARRQDRDRRLPITHGRAE
jgi:hypothetical protein